VFQVVRVSVFFCVLAPVVFAQGVIHKCVDEHGNLAFQDSPCPEPDAVPVPETADDPAVMDESPAVEPAQDVDPQDVVLYEAVESNRSANAVEACKEPHRDAIDAIEAEMLRGYSADEGETFKQELRTLTQAMRACE
jgi:hypothetical protein